MAYNKIDQLVPEFQPIVIEILDRLTGLGYQPIIAEAYRTKEQQREKVKLGYSKTMKSKHIERKAVDIVDKRYMWNIGLTHKFWYDYGMIVKELQHRDVNKCNITWGGVWKRGTTRWPIFERAHKEQKSSLLTWFVDVAHTEYNL